MTRINLVHPSQLTDDHLRGEYKELPRVFTAVKKAIVKGKTPADFDIPEHYVLGKGHVTFFYNKLHYIFDRHSDLFHEMLSRGYSPNSDMFLSIRDSYIDDIGKEWKCIYDPTPDEIYLNMSRLCIRSKLDNVLKEIETNGG